MSDFFYGIITPVQTHQSLPRKNKGEYLVQQQSKKQSKPAIVFDFGGVLLDWKPYYFFSKFFNGDPITVDNFLNEIGFFEWNLRQDEGLRVDQAIAELIERFPQYASIIQDYNQNWQEAIAGAIQPTVDLLHELKQKEYSLHGLSNWAAEKFNIVRRGYAFFDLFDSILLSSDVRLIKPDPRIYLALLERIKRSADECVFIDDSEANVTAARQLGFDAIHFVSSDQLCEELSSRGLLTKNGSGNKIF
jgi:2-haloacid dehalogenase